MLKTYPGDAQMQLPVERFVYNMNEENSGQQCKSWLQSFKCFIEASGVQDDQHKLNLLLHFAGKELQDLYAQLPGTECVNRGNLASGYVLQQTETTRKK
ncbi:uncharacterized protein [Eurosta solidaginis]|uniref:uncharacterized protein isoform X3 n=1 Tax=Eurosta solidaginis TaxID=178769 RepID=UPI003530FD5D